MKMKTANNRKTIAGGISTVQHIIVTVIIPSHSIIMIFWGRQMYVVYISIKLLLEVIALHCEHKL
jgi:hypothetical protein